MCTWDDHNFFSSFTRKKLKHYFFSVPCRWSAYTCMWLSCLAQNNSRRAAFSRLMMNSAAPGYICVFFSHFISWKKIRTALASLPCPAEGKHGEISLCLFQVFFFFLIASPRNETNWPWIIPFYFLGKKNSKIKNNSFSHFVIKRFTRNSFTFLSINLYYLSSCLFWNIVERLKHRRQGEMYWPWETPLRKLNQ